MVFLVDQKLECALLVAIVRLNCERAPVPNRTDEPKPKKRKPKTPVKTYEIEKLLKQVKRGRKMFYEVKLRKISKVVKELASEAFKIFPLETVKFEMLFSLWENDWI